MPLAGRLDDDQRDVPGLQPALDLMVAVDAVGDAERDAGGKDVHVEPAFAHVDTDIRFQRRFLFGQVLAV